MCDYRCPACDGGFPAQNDPDECPWCGETMAAPLGESSSQLDPLSSLPSGRFDLPDPGPRPQGSDRGRRPSRPLFEDDADEELFDTLSRRRRERTKRLDDRFADNGEVPDDE